MKKAKITTAYRQTTVAAKERLEEAGVATAAIELEDGTTLTAEGSPLLGPSAALLLNALKHLAGIAHNVKLIPQTMIEPIQKTKVTYLHGRNPRLHTDEVLVAISMMSLIDENCKMAIDQLPNLAGAQVHSTVMLSEVDRKTFNKPRSFFRAAPFMKPPASTGKAPSAPWTCLPGSPRPSKNSTANTSEKGRLSWTACSMSSPGPIRWPSVIIRPPWSICPPFPIPGRGGDSPRTGSSSSPVDGSSSLYFLDKDLRTTRKMQVSLNGRPLRYLNELEYINGKIWANVYTTDTIVIIDPSTGKVEGLVDCAGLLPASLRRRDTDVLNGIAVDGDGRIYLTGKNWPRLYQIELIEATVWE